MLNTSIYSTHIAEEILGKDINNILYKYGYNIHIYDNFFKNQLEIQIINHNIGELNLIGFYYQNSYSKKQILKILKNHPIYNIYTKYNTPLGKILYK